MLNDFTGGGQIFLHKLRMFFQVLHRSFMTSLLVSLAIVGFISYKPAQILDLKAAMTYQKALLAEGFDEASRGIRQTINPRAKYYYTTIDAYDKKGLHARDIDPRKIIKSNFYRAAYLEAKDFLKIRLVFTALVMCGIFLLIYLLWSRFGRDVKSEKKKEGSGRILSAKEVSSILKSINKAGHFYIGAMPLVKDSETKHFLVTGSTGSGKTNLIHNILPQVEKKKQPAIIIDQTGEMIAKYYNQNRGDIIFNPFDARSQEWDFWSDCNTTEELERFAKILFGFNRKRTGHSADPFWEQSAESVFIACANYQKSIGDLRIEQLCSLARNSSLRGLQAKLKNSEASRYLESDNKTTASSILSVLATNAKPLSYLRECTPENSFSLKEYFKNIDQGSGNFLFLATKPSCRDLTLALIACMAESAFSRLLDIGIKEDRRIWFVIDELSALGKLPSLPTLMAEGRKYGACVLSGLQSLNQLYSNYGQYEGSTIFGQFGTNFFFRNNEPAIAKTISSMAGRETIYRQQKNTSFGAHEFRDGVSYSEQQQHKDLIEYSDLASLAVGECFALMPEPQVRVVKLEIPEAKLTNKNEGFIQSENSITESQEQYLVQDIEDDNNDLQKLESLEHDSSQSLDNFEQEKDHNLEPDNGIVKY
jgi:type IV conjugative transfer system coupling protein TraD